MEQNGQTFYHGQNSPPQDPAIPFAWWCSLPGHTTYSWELLGLGGKVVRSQKVAPFFLHFMAKIEWGVSTIHNEEINMLVLAHEHYESI